VFKASWPILTAFSNSIFKSCHQVHHHSHRSHREEQGLGCISGTLMVALVVALVDQVVARASGSTAPLCMLREIVERLVEGGVGPVGGVGGEVIFVVGKSILEVFVSIIILAAFATRRNHLAHPITELPLMELY
jgi:hypothetical protein